MGTAWRGARLRGTVTSLLLAAAVAAGAEEWSEVRTPNFVVVSNAGEKRARRAAVELEQIRAVFDQAIDAPPARLAPLTVLAVDDEKSLSRLLSRSTKTLGGIFRPGPFRRDAALRFDASDATHVVYHEYFHVVLDHHTPGMPPWLDEGLAEFWAGTRIRGDRVELGRANEDHLRLLRTREPYAVEELLAVDHASPLYATQLFYAQSWALVHYLMFGDEAARGALGRYVALLGAGTPGERAASTAFGDLPRLRTQLRLYVRRPAHSVGILQVPLEIEDVSLEARRLTEAEADVARGLFVVNGSAPEEAEPLFARALELDADSAGALEGMGLLELRRGDDAAAREWLARAVEQESASYLAHYHYAALVRASPRDAAASAREERHLKRAIALNPLFAGGYERLAIFYALRDPDLRRALKLATAAVECEPGSADLRLLHARLLHAGGLADPAREGVETARRLAMVGQPSVASRICWDGSLAGFAGTVMSACELAVRAEPDRADFRDSRGLARALTGDLAGAAADFRAYAESDEGRDATRRLRLPWIAALEAGRNPFDEALLTRLRRLPF